MIVILMDENDKINDILNDKNKENENLSLKV